MGDFSRLSNFNPNANYKFVRIGADCPVLEIELNEMQQISEQRLQDIVKNFIGDGVKGVGSYAYSNGTLTVSDEEIIIDGIPLKITTLKLPIAEGERAYIQMWLKEVTYQDTLKYMGNVQETRTIENKILDTNIGSETSRRMQMQYDLVKDTNQRSDLNPVNLYIGTITGGKFVLDAPLLKTYTNTKHVQKFLVTQNQTDFHTEGAFRINSNALEVYVDGVLQLMGYDEDYIEVANNLFRFNTPVRTGSEVIARYSNAIQSESRPNTHGSSHNATGDDPIDISDLADRYGVRDKLTKSSQVLKDLGTAIDKAEPLVSNINSRLSDFHSQNDTMQKAITTAQGIKNDLTTQNSNAVNNKNGLDSSINNAKKFIERLDDSQNLPQMREDINSLKNGLQVNQSLAYKGTDLTCENSLEGRTCNVLIKGQTYQNLIKNGQQETELNVSINTHAKYSYNYALKNNTDYTLIFTANSVSDTNTVISFNEGNLGIERKILNGVNIVKTHTNDKDKYLSVWFYYNNGITSDKVTGTIKNVILLEGDWTNKEVPSSITGIESVGEKENNKISILSHNKNLLPSFNEWKIIRGNVTHSGNNEITQVQTTIWGDQFDSPLFPVYGTGDYYITATDGLTSYKYQLQITCYDKNKNRIGNVIYQDKTKFTITDNNVKYLMFSINTGQSVEGTYIFKDWQFEKGSQTDYTSYKQDKKEILIGLDGGLKSLPDGTCDTIEQREDGVYLLQRIDKVIFNGSENWNIDGGFTNQSQKVMRFSHGLNNASVTLGGSGDKIICDTLPISDNELGATLPKIWCSWKNYIYIDIDPTKLNISYANDNNDTKINKFKAWLQANPTTVYYLLATPIETKLGIKDINLETYDGVTYVTCQTNILPEITFSIPSNLGSLVQNNAKNINDIYKLIDEVLIPQITQNALDIDLLKVK